MENEELRNQVDELSMKVESLETIILKLTEFLKLEDFYSVQLEFLMNGLNDDKSSLLMGYLIQFTEIEEEELPSISEVTHDINELVERNMDVESVTRILTALSKEMTMIPAQRILAKANKV